ncbi:MAG: movement protein [Tomato betanucleorhabdovirus 1]|uniref:Movement protein n=1 Tax=Tomato betanucleorhabdovirus 1 TaxID=2950850 RepID=A0AAE9SIL6_9RHAB|nr:MAG: movement protein [Tomato betanucleorhabdovirus 1]
MSGSSKASKTSKTIENETERTASLKAYDEVVMRGHEANVCIKKESFGLTTRMLLLINSMAWNKVVEFSIKKLVILWCPTVEPGNLSTINLEVSYYLGEEVDDLRADETVVNLRGRISESLKAVVFPTKSILKNKNDAFFMPWKFAAKLDDCMGIDKDATMGILKLWCMLDMTLKPKFNRVASRAYIHPIIEWTNDYYPYYVPFYLIKAVRGIKPMLWRDTAQYKKFAREVIPHTDNTVILPASYLTLMQILSKADIATMNDITKNCHLRQGGLCTCGDNMDKFLASALLNNNGKCNNHGAKYDDITNQVYTGHITTAEGALDIVF